MGRYPKITWDSTLMQLSTTECQDCDASCLTCLGPSATECTSCRLNYYLSESNPTLHTGTCQVKTPSTSTFTLTVTGLRTTPDTATATSTLLGALNLAKTLTYNTKGAQIEIVIDSSVSHAILHSDYVKFYEMQQTTYPQYKLRIRSSGA